MIIYLFIFNFMIIINCFFIILSKNIITAIINLIIVFILTAVSLILLGAEFIATIIVIIYVGAIVILFLFVIMLLNLRIVEVYNASINKITIGLLLGLYFFIIFFLLLKSNTPIFIFNTDNNLLNYKLYNYSLIYSMTNLQLLGIVLYKHYIMFILYAAVLLLIGMLGSMYLTVDFNYHIIKYKKIRNYSITKSGVAFYRLKNSICKDSLTLKKNNNLKIKW